MNAPRVFLFAHELAAAAAQGTQSGTGSAHFIDAQNDVPAVVHLRLFEGAADASSPVPLIWAVNATGTGAQVPTVAPPAGSHVLLRVDQGAPDLLARCRIVLAGHTFEVDAEIVESGAQAFTRNTPIIESALLAQRTVLCIGLGSGGSQIVDQLARAGVGGFILWDFDRLEAHNVGRHVCTLRDLGRYKVDAMGDHVLSINPLARVRCVKRDVLECAGPGRELEQAIHSADCVVVGTDNNASRFAINELAWNSRPAFYGRAFTRACGGDVIQVIPALGLPCYACHLGDRVVDEEISSPKDAQRVAYADKPVAVQPGLNVDIQPLSNMIARLALLRLCAGTGSSLTSVAEELDAPLYLWGNRREANFAAWQPMERAFGRLSILRWYGITVQRDPECVVCGNTSAA